MEPATSSAQVFRFGLFEADAARNTLTRKGVRVKIQDQPFRVLILLLEQPGEIVTREELRQNLWPEGTFVDFEGGLNVTLRKLRSALDDDSDNPRFIETVPRRGYRFIAPVKCEGAPDTSLIGIPPQVLNSPNAQTDSVQSARKPQIRHWPWLGIAGLAVLTVIGWRYMRSRQSTAPPARKVIAVLPFVNEGAGPDFDYLSYAIPNDLVTDLTYVQSVAVRPFASTSLYGSQPFDAETVGKQLRVTHVVAGGFLLDQQNLRINLELIDVAQNKPVWREEVTVSPHGLVALHDKLALRAAKGLLPAIDISNASTTEMPSPKSEQALDLFLHSLTVPLDPEPNQFAIQKLEESVSLDSGYAPAWGELGWRYYIDYHYGNGGDAAVAKALQAYKRQSELDPNQPAVSTTIRVEQGDLNGAYDQAADYLRRRPDVSIAHYSMSYVLRYAGLLKEASQQCDAALALDPGFNVFRSCATPSMLAGDYAHAQIYVRLDEHSGVGALYRMVIALRKGDTNAALAELDAASRASYVLTHLVRSYLEHAPQEQLRQAAAAVEADPRSARDAEELYRNAEILSMSGQLDASLRELRLAIKGNYCSYPAMQNDPLLDPIRKRTEFTELLHHAVQCQQKFLAYRERAVP